MQRVRLETVFFETVDKKPVRLDHDDRITGLHGQNDVRVVLILSYAKELQSAFNHPCWIVSVAVDDPVGQ